MANDFFWQLSVFAYNISVMMRQKKDKFKRQEHRTFIDWFISVPAKIIRSGHQTEIKMYENHFYKADWEELDRLIEAAKNKEKNEKNKNRDLECYVVALGGYRSFRSIEIRSERWLFGV